MISLPVKTIASNLDKNKKNEGSFEEFFVEDGTAEYFNDNLIILSTSAINIKDVSKNFLDNLDKDIEKKLADQTISDHDKYILNHKLNTIREMVI